jgi:hypothetical protein
VLGEIIFMARKLTSTDIMNILGEEHVGKSKGAFIVRRGYFYHGITPEQLAEKVKSKIPNAVILDKGDHWAPFRGGDSVAKGSNIWVRFTIGEGSTAETGIF